MVLKRTNPAFAARRPERFASHAEQELQNRTATTTGSRLQPWGRASRRAGPSPSARTADADHLTRSHGSRSSRPRWSSLTTGAALTLVDGSTRLGVLWRITLPLVLPGLIATATFAFIFSWTEFLFAVIFTGTNAFTLPKTIAGYVGSQGTNYGQATSLAIVATAPLFVLGLLVQKHFVRGLTLGAIRA